MTPPEQTPGAPLARWRVRLGYPVAAVCFWLARPTLRSIAWGGGIALIGLGIRAAAAGHLRKGEALAVSGPYAYTRNPLYLGSALLAAGFVLASASCFAAALLILYFAAFYPAVMRREERELRERYGAEFEAYAARVPLFWPRLTPVRPPGDEGAGFTWARYRRNREYQAALGFLLAIGVLAALATLGWWRR